MTGLDLTVRYFQDSTPPDVACREEHFRRREFSMPLPVAQTALVLVDIWNTHFIESWRDRAEHVTLTALVPVLAAARQVGLTIVPRALGGCRRAISPSAVLPAPPSETPPTPPDWPPPAFRSRTGPYAVLPQPPASKRRAVHRTGQTAWRCPPILLCRPASPWLPTAHSSTHSCRDRRILHLLYVGFAINWCVLGKGLRQSAP